MRYAGLYVGLFAALLAGLVFMLSGYWGAAVAALCLLAAGLAAAAIERGRR